MKISEKIMVEKSELINLRTRYDESLQVRMGLEQELEAMTKRNSELEKNNKVVGPKLKSGILENIFLVTLEILYGFANLILIALALAILGLIFWCLFHYPIFSLVAGLILTLSFFLGRK